MYVKKLIHPEFFQGNKKKKNYFEGWYYKTVSQDGKYTLAFIPGISLNDLDPHAFIQVFISKQLAHDMHLESHYFRFEQQDFAYGYDQFYVSIKDNYFSKESLKINLSNEKIHLKGDISLEGITPIKKSLFIPNIMGFFGYFNFMECYHGVVSMTHLLHGKFALNDEVISFEGSKGYIEKDWGKSFPRAYVWLQSNHFKNETTSLMFSYADIPFLGFYFKGLIANLRYEGKEYRFATYNFARVKKEIIEPRKVYYELKKGQYLIEIEGVSHDEIDLASPRNGQMIESIKEGLSGHIKIKFYHKNKLIFEDTGEHAGIEIMKK